jgi:hypothetical protein
VTLPLPCPRARADDDGCQLDAATLLRRKCCAISAMASLTSRSHEAVATDVPLNDSEGAVVAATVTSCR